MSFLEGGPNYLKHSAYSMILNTVPKPVESNCKNNAIFSNQTSDTKLLLLVNAFGW